MPLVQKKGQIIEVSADQFPQPTLAERKDKKMQDLAARRFIAEEGGTTLGGTPIATDRTTQGKVTAAYVKASADSNYTIAAWKGTDGTFSPLDAATIIAIADAIEAHVQSCFTREATLSASITTAANEAELNAVNIETGWP